MAKANKPQKEKKMKPETAVDPVEEASLVKPPKVKKPEKVKKVKVKKEKKAPVVGITTVDLETLAPGEAPSCEFEPVTGGLTLRLPRALDGAPGPQGPQGLPGAAGEPGPQGLRGMEGEAGKGVDYTRAPGGEDDYYLFVDAAGRLNYYAKGRIALVILESQASDAVEPV